MRKFLLGAALIALLAGCGVGEVPLPELPEARTTLTVVEAEPIEPTLCGQPCFLFYRVVVEVSPAPEELVVTDFAVTTPGYEWPQPAGEWISKGTYSQNGPYYSSCAGSRCELYFTLKTWHVDETFYPAVLAYADAMAVVETPLP